MRIDNPSISGSLSFIGGTNTLSGTSVSLTGSLTGTFEGSFSSAATANISGAFDSVSASLAGRVSPLETSVTALNSASSSYLLNTSDTLTGDLTVTGTITAQEFHTEFVSASIIYQSGSTQFGNSSDDTHVFTGRIGIGTDTPSTDLEISSTNPEIYLTDTSASPDGGVVKLSNVNTDFIINVDPDNVADSSTIQFELDGTERMRLNANGFGIGTVSPQDLLHVYSDSTDANLMIQSTYTGGDARLKLIGNSGGVSQIRFEDEADANVGLLTYQHSDNSMQFRTNDSERMRIDSSGNVSLATGDLFINSGTNYNDKGYIYLSNQRTAIISDIVNLTANGDTSLDFQTRSGGSTASSMFIDEFRRVGIGTTSPGAKLDVNGLTAIGIGTQALNADAELTLRGGVEYIGLDIKSARTSGNIGGLRWYGTASDSTPVAQMLVTTDGTYGYLNGTNGAEYRLRIDSSGNVGIGTASPSSSLDVFSSDSSGTRTNPHNVITVTAENPNLPYTGFGGGIVFKNRTYNAGITTGARIRSVINYDGYVGQEYGTSIAFDTTPTLGSALTQSLIIKYDGNVGIGTNTPDTKLHVSGYAVDNVGLVRFQNFHATGDIMYPALQVINDRGNHSYGTVAEFRISNASDGDRPSIMFSKGGTGNNWSIGMGVYSGGVDSFTIGHRSTYYQDAWATPIITVTTGGNVGIGTTGPANSGKLNIKTNGSDQIGTGIRLINPYGFDSANTGVQIVFAQDRSESEDFIMAGIRSCQTYAGTSDYGDLRFFTRNSGNVVERMRILSSGGITFNGDTAADNALDDYEEGTFTPTLDNAGTPNYSRQYGKYTKIGNLVFVTIKIEASNITSSGNTVSFNLPFTSADASDTAQRSSGLVEGDWVGMGSYVATTRFRVAGAYVQGVRDSGSGSSVYLAYNNLDSSIEFNTSITYLT